MNGLAHPEGTDEDRGLQRIGGLKLLLRCDAGPAIGLGHVKRCIALAGWLEEDPIFALADTPSTAHEQIRAAGFQSIELNGLDDDALRPLREIGADAILCDIAHNRSRNERAAMREHVAAVSRLGVPVAFIDDVEADALLDDELAAKIALCIRPYPGVAKGAHGRWLVGLQYFIVSPEGARIAYQPRKFGDHVRSILITTGGSDVAALGPRIVAELNAVDDERYTVRVVIGPMVPRSTQEATRAAAENSPHEMIIVQGRHDLTADMRWCDLAIATTGLTKYELALNAAPSILISPDHYHDMNNASFRACGTAVDLGVTDDLPPGAIADAVRRVARDRSMRQRLADRGRGLIDGLGAGRLLSAIKELTDAR